MRNPLYAVIKCKSRDMQSNPMRKRPVKLYDAGRPVLDTTHQILWKGAVNFEEQPE